MCGIVAEKNIIVRDVYNNVLKNDESELDIESKVFDDFQNPNPTYEDVQFEHFSSVIDNVIWGLEKLEYRGYDSCGIAYKDSGLKVTKVKGYISELKGKVSNIKSNIAIGHTRWATHGKPSTINSHPHLSEQGNFAVVHNGIIENYEEIKGKFLSKVNFKSKTDTEVIPNLIEHFYEETHDVMRAFILAINILKGAYAFVMINNIDNTLYFVRVFSPLVLSKSDNSYSLASDINGLKDLCNVMYLPDNSYGIIEDDIKLFDFSGNKIDIEFTKCESEKNSELGQYAYYMEKEIFEIPKSIENTYNYLKNLKLNLPNKIDNVLIIACGTSYHSSLIWKKLLARVNISAECEIASEFIYNDYVIRPNTLAVFITQSGETADTIKALKKAKKLGLYTLAITNVATSSITKLTHENVCMKCGAEICVASTKAYTTQIFVGIMLATLFEAINNNEFMSSDTLSNNLSMFDMLDNENIENSMFDENYIMLHNYKIINVDMSRVLRYLPFSEKEFEDLLNIDIDKIEKDIILTASELYNKKTLHIIGKDFDYITAMESSLKIKEISYMFTDAYPSGELKHGTISLIDENSYVIAILTDRKLLDKCQNSIQEICSRGGKIILFSNIDDHNFSDIHSKINIPKSAEVFRSITAIIPIQLLAYKITCLLGQNPDKPRNLAKSVTVE